MQLQLRSSAAALAALIAITAALLGAMHPTSADASVAQQTHSASTTATTKTKRATVKLADLTVISTEDASGLFGNGDELYIRSGGRIIWRSQGSVEEGARQIAVNRTVKVGATVALYDADGGPDNDDLLGAEIVEGTSGFLKFKNDDARYGLPYGN
jgi:hypothetical protein